MDASTRFPRRTLLERLRAMSHALNDEAGKGSPFDPLFSADFSVDVEFPADPPAEDQDLPEGTVVSWGVVFSSGHGPESAHLLSRKVSFTFRDGLVKGGTLEDGSLQRHDFEDFEVAGPDQAERLEELRSHLAQVLPTVDDLAAVDDFVLVKDHVFPRDRAMMVGVAMGIGIGIGNAMLGVSFPSWLATLGLLILSLAVVLLLHEGLHGLAGKVLGYAPIFGVEPPLVFTTFNEKVRRTHLVIIALAPLVILDAVFVAAYVVGPWPVFWNVCFAVNTIGAIGDCWISWKVLGHSADTWFQDTKSGTQAWRAQGALLKASS